ncbi:MAG: DUF1365 domain-containing protein [Polaromonas sp.]|uniref:DUF1365 domain-containing protein n=1 Tax=Polaromonas sp. TaxID=1869339 RepID=UPI003264D10F
MNQSVPLMGFGQVRHSRLRPQRHAFAYPTYFLMLPMRSLQKQAPQPGRWHINRRGALSFFETDHGDGRAPEQGGAIAWLDEVLQREGIHDATGEAWLHTSPRVLGYTFKPVSFWYCHRAADDREGGLRAIVVEVNNTFGERHCYVLDAPRYGVTQRADKVFHVSPFNPVQGHYRFRFMRSVQGAHARTVARVDFYDDIVADAAVLQTSVSGTLQPITPAVLRRAVWRYPAMTLGVVLHIHIQALRLWLKKVPFFHKPAPPQTFVSR